MSHRIRKEKRRYRKGRCLNESQGTEGEVLAPLVMGYGRTRVGYHRIHRAVLPLLQFLVSAVLGRYSLVCQPVDYSSHPDALRVGGYCIHINRKL